MKYTTCFWIISLTFLFACKSDNKETSSSVARDMSESELVRVTRLIDPSPATYQEGQINDLIRHALDHNWPVHKSESGLLYWIQKPGNDVRAEDSSQILVRYSGELLDGKLFDQSPKTGEPVQFTLSEMIPAWQEALKLIGEEGKITILAHSDLGYRGQRIANLIPPYSPLIFEIELIDIRKGN